MASRIWQYLLFSDLASPVRGLPRLPPGYLGSYPKFAELGLSTVSHSDPFIRVKSAELCVRLAYQPNLPLKWRADLIFVSNKASEHWSHMVCALSPFCHLFLSNLTSHKNQHSTSY
ncbi:unnamed protein product [Dibothriocephalus latus]|uniref:Uncharacterized protein n=1 Tax=Dibothriocephalus latus TaxID=60516 RepID=A0A3P6TM31_DIBLA|nr:unnamed protein product [Dibothriocephalus latus]